MDYWDIYKEYSTLIGAGTLVALLMLSSVIGFVSAPWRMALLLLILFFAALNGLDFYSSRLDQKTTEEKVSAALRGLEERLLAASDKIQKLDASLSDAAGKLSSIDAQSRFIQMDMGDAQTSLRELPASISQVEGAISSLKEHLDTVNSKTSKRLGAISRDAEHQRKMLDCQDRQRVFSGDIYGSAYGAIPCR